jgi:putative endonuclease
MYVYDVRSNRRLYTGVTSNPSAGCGAQTKTILDSLPANFLRVLRRDRRITGRIAREKEIKAWRRSKKVALIESVNPEWSDLSEWLSDG